MANEWETDGQKISVEPGYWYKVAKDGFVWRKLETRGRKKVTVPVTEQKEEAKV